jgi:hypothetical protein
MRIYSHKRGNTLDPYTSLGKRRAHQDHLSEEGEDNCEKARFRNFDLKI